jgi:HME family heavy-metal exporter
MGAIPLALIGSVVALKITGQPLSVASMIGFITLAGISARNGILKISHYINLAIHEGERFGTGLIVRGSMERLSPVLMTALCAGLALTPLLIGADEPGREILHPVAVTIFGGLLSATILDTVVTPYPRSDVRQKAAGPAAGRTHRNVHPRGSLLISAQTKEHKMRKFAFLTMIAVIAAMPGFAAAQTKKGSNGGPIVTSQGHPIEFVRKGMKSPST